MTIQEAILKSLDDINELANSVKIHEHIVQHKYYDFGNAPTPLNTISSRLGDFIRNGDTRVKRIKQEGGTYAYYLTKNEQNIGIDILSGETETKTTKVTKTTKTKTFEGIRSSNPVAIRQNCPAPYIGTQGFGARFGLAGAQKLAFEAILLSTIFRGLALLPTCRAAALQFC